MSKNPYLIPPPPPPEMALWWSLQQHQAQEEDNIPMGIPIFQNPIPLCIWLPDQPQPFPLTWPGEGGNQPPPQPLMQQQQQRRHQRVPERMKESLFEKALTPSDVGKLNRLVIPKAYALTHLPRGATSASADGAKGMLLDFEDDAGKGWSFRYSYWKSSQSYVLTRGWSRYVKEYNLKPGDIVAFHSHRRNPNRRFVSWRRRPPGAVVPGRVRRRRDELIEMLGAGIIGGAGNNNNNKFNNNEMSVGFAAVPAILGWMNGGHYPQPQPSFNPDNNFLLSAAGIGGTQGGNETTVAAENNGTRSSDSGVRLFGVNMRAPPADN